MLGEVSGVRAIMQGKDRDRGVLKDLPEASDFIEGERVLSSGEGGAFPRGLVAGTVTKQGSEWLVKLAMRDHASGYVRMIAPPEIVEPLPESEVPEVVVPPVETAKPAPAARPAPARPVVTEPVTAAVVTPETDPPVIRLPETPVQGGE